MLRVNIRIRSTIVMAVISIPVAALLGAAGGRTTGFPAGAVVVFTNSGQSLGGETGNGVALGDLDGDGDTDAFVANDYSDFGEANQVWFNEGGDEGNFVAGPMLGTEDGNAVALGDLDDDGDLDAVVGMLSPLSGMVWINQGGAQGGNEGDFAAGDSFGSFSAYAVAIGDVDLDGDLDAFVAGNSNQAWLNDGDGAFTAGPALPFQFSDSVTLADLDDDGWPDAVIGDAADGSNNRVWWNDGNWDSGPGSFAQGDAMPAGHIVHGTGVADLDQDGGPDIFLATGGQDQIYWNDGSRDFSAGAPLAVDDNSFSLVLGDVDGDGLVDAVVGNVTADPNRVWRNEGGRVFMPIQEFGDEIGQYWARALGLADLNGDGAADLFEATAAEDRVWFNSTVAPGVIPNEEGWQVQTVDARGDAGYTTSLALDANGYPHISYNRRIRGPNGTVSYLMYTRWDGVRWRTETVRGNVFSKSSLALDAAGNPHIAFRMGTSAVVGYAHWDGGAWQVQSVDQVSFPQTFGLGSLALDANDNPHIVYNTFNNGSGNPELLKHAYWDGAAWQVQTVDNGLVYDSALALDANGAPHAGYAIRSDFDTYVLKYAFWDGLVWQTEIVDGEVEDAGVFSASLTLDTGGDPHLGYVLDAFTGAAVVKYAYQDGGNWQLEPVSTLDSVYAVEDIELDLDSGETAHLIYFITDDEDYALRYAYRDGASWQEETLDGGEGAGYLLRVPVLGASLDADDRLHTSYYEPHHEDLRYITWAPNWQMRTIPDAGMMRSPSLAVQTAIEGITPHIAYYNETGGQVKLTSWDSAWELNPLDFVGDPVTEVSMATGNLYEHVSYYDADNQRLMYSRWDSAQWNMEVVDEAGNVGSYNDLLLVWGSDALPRIAYWDATSQRIKLARPLADFVLWEIFPNLVALPLDAGSGPLSATGLPGGDVGVAYYHGANGNLRLGVWDALTGTWADELVDGAASDAGRLNDVQTDWTEGVPIVAYYDETNDAINLAYKAGGGWQIETAVLGAGGVTSLSLELGFDSRTHARIAYTAGGALHVALLRDGVWEIQEVESGAASAPGDVSLALSARPHLAYTRSAGGLRYAFRSATLDVDPTRPEVPPGQTGGDYNPLDPCGEDPSPGENIEAGGSAFAPRFLLPGSHEEAHDDRAIFGAMAGLFAGTGSGQQYIDLYFQHGAEMGQLGLEDPQLLWDGYGALQNFLPGLEALVTGHGDEVVVTQKMVDDALSIWQRLAAAGSPPLAATINAELTAYNNLQLFVGMTFDEWAIAIGVTPPPEEVYLPVIAR